MGVSLSALQSMIFSPVVSKGVSWEALGLLRSNPNLFNVAITRAPAAVIVSATRKLPSARTGLMTLTLTLFDQHTAQSSSHENDGLNLEISRRNVTSGTV